MDMVLSENFSENLRRQPRSVFIYPVEFELSPSETEPAFFNGQGYLKDISSGGAGLQFEDKYGRFILGEEEKVEFRDKYGRFNITAEAKVVVRILLNVQRGEKVTLLSHIQWIKKDEKTFHIKMGLEFSELESCKLEAVEKLMGLKGKDHNMIWTLWEQYKDRNMMLNLWEQDLHLTTGQGHGRDKR
jgi:hypothetical protein